jgi:hypothetical protein
MMRRLALVKDPVSAPNSSERKSSLLSDQRNGVHGLFARWGQDRALDAHTVPVDERYASAETVRRGLDRNGERSRQLAEARKRFGPEMLSELGFERQLIGTAGRCRGFNSH